MNTCATTHHYVKRRGLKVALAVLVALGLLAGMTHPAAQQSSAVVDFYQAINRARLNDGLAPLGLSTLLTQAAQRHADDIAKRAAASHEGADGSDYRQRIREAGYRAWNDGLLVNEVVWLGLGGPVEHSTVPQPHRRWATPTCAIGNGGIR